MPVLRAELETASNQTPSLFSDDDGGAKKSKRVKPKKTAIPEGKLHELYEAYPLHRAKAAALKALGKTIPLLAGRIVP